MFLVTSVVTVDLTTFLYNPFEHHHEVNLVAATSKELAFHTPPEVTPPVVVASVIVVVKAGQAGAILEVAVLITYVGLTVVSYVLNKVLLLQQAPPSAAAVEYHVDSSVVGTSWPIDVAQVVLAD